MLITLKIKRRKTAFSFRHFPTFYHRHLQILIIQTSPCKTEDNFMFISNKSILKVYKHGKSGQWHSPSTASLYFASALFLGLL